MSAYMLDKIDIDRLIATLIVGPLDAQEWEELIPNAHTFANELGEILLKENLSSIHYRYPDTMTGGIVPGPCDPYWLKPYQFEPTIPINHKAALDLVHCYEYQSCEHPEWETSVALKIMRLLDKALKDCPLVPEPPKPPKPQVKHYSITETAKIIRAELKKAFPETKFSVRSKVYSMGCSITVWYTDGPPTKAVESIVAPFHGTGFDGMTDSTTYHDSEYNGEPCHFAGSMTHVSRDHSKILLADDRILRPEQVAQEILRARITGSDNYSIERMSWAVVSSWDARYETIERTCERFLAEGCRNAYTY